MAERSGVFFMLLIWHRSQRIARGLVPLSQLSQKGGRVAVVSDNVAEAIADLSIPELFGEVQAKEHGTIQVGRGLILLGGRGAKDFVSHADIIGTAPPPIVGQSGQSANWTRAAALSITNSTGVSYIMCSNNPQL